MSETQAIDQWVENPLAPDPQGVLLADDHPSLDYTDGHASEQYLHRVFDAAGDLSSTSAELETWIKDWPSEYHLSRRRTQLLRGLDYRRDAAVLEVGCGCGAITRFLGESFDRVIAVEGALPRARLARKRCRDLASVDVISAPFQEIRFQRKFDIIFCIGVFEYSHYFVAGDDPYAGIVDYFSRHLNPGGVLVLAIENQFGLKYFASASEDHSGIPYDGLEGYPRGRGKARTFGAPQLRSLLSQGFDDTEFYFPFPDYKIVDGLLAERALQHLDPSEMLGRFRSRDYGRPYSPRFSERRAWREICANGQLPFFAHSFLVLARKAGGEAGSAAPVSGEALALVYNRDRAEPAHTLMRVLREADGSLVVDKQLLNRDPTGAFGPLPYRERWVPGQSLHSLVLQRAQREQGRLEEIFAPVGQWLQHLREQADPQGQLPGDRVDAIWQNAMLESGGGITLIDLEWRAPDPVPLRVLLLRAIYRFLVDLRQEQLLAKCLRNRTTRSLLLEVSGLLGEPAGAADVDAFIALETELRSAASGCDQAASRRHILRVMRLPQRSGRWLQCAALAREAWNIYRDKAIRVLQRLLQWGGR